MSHGQGFQGHVPPGGRHDHFDPASAPSPAQDFLGLEHELASPDPAVQDWAVAPPIAAHALPPSSDATWLDQHEDAPQHVGFGAPSAPPPSYEAYAAPHARALGPAGFAAPPEPSIDYGYDAPGTPAPSYGAYEPPQARVSNGASYEAPHPAASNDTRYDAAPEQHAHDAEHDAGAQQRASYDAHDAASQHHASSATQQYTGYEAPHFAAPIDTTYDSASQQHASRAAQGAGGWLDSIPDALGPAPQSIANHGAHGVAPWNDAAQPAHAAATYAPRAPLQRAQPPAAPLAQVPASWLMQPDEAQSNRAGVEPFFPRVRSFPISSPPSDASYCDEPSRAGELAPWIVRGLVGAAAVCFALVLVQAFRARAREVPPIVAPALAPAPSSASKSATPLADPGRAIPSASSGTSARPSPRGTSSKSAARASDSGPSAAPTSVVVPSSSSLDAVQGPAPVVAARSEAAELPAWWPGAFPRAPRAGDRAPEEDPRSAEARERLDRWLLVHARSAAPAADALAPKSSRSDGVEHATKPANAALLAGEQTWDETTIPIERVVDDVRLATPKVGRVRFALRNGEVLEGNLAALGGGKLWLDASVGRVEVPANDVATIEPLGAVPSAAAEIASLPRMRVRTPGKTYYGKILDRGDDGVLVLTDSGERVRLRTDDIEAAPPRAVPTPAPAPAAISKAPAPQPTSNSTPR